MRYSAVVLLLAVCMGLPVAAAAKDRVNIRTNPLMVFGTIVNLEVDVRLGEHYSLGPVLQVSGIERTYQTGLRLSRYENAAFQRGWLFSLAATAGQEEGDYLYEDGVFSDEAEKGFRALVGAHQGYLWRWDTFTTTLGAGAQVEYQELEDRVSLHSLVHFTIGWVR